MVNSILVAARWLGIWFFYVCLVVLAGALLGVLTHLAFGLLFMVEPDYRHLTVFGASNGAKFGGVWAGGVAIVLCFMRGHRENSKRAGVNERE